LGCAAGADAGFGGAGAAGVAGAIKEKHLHGGKRIGIVLTGGNIDREDYARVLAGKA